VGGFTVAEALPPDEVQLLPLPEALRDYPTVRVSDEIAAMVRNGRVLPRFAGEGPWAVLDGAGELLAMYESAGPATVKPAVVIAAHGL
jgi:hypothetical protein